MLIERAWVMVPILPSVPVMVMNREAGAGYGSEAVRQLKIQTPMIRTLRRLRV